MFGYSFFQLLKAAPWEKLSAQLTDEVYKYRDVEAVAPGKKLRLLLYNLSFCVLFGSESLNGVFLGGNAGGDKACNQGEQGAYDNQRCAAFGRQGGL